MFLDTLFHIDSKTINDNEATFTVGLNPLHPIYGGHFPNDPITPGVCVVQIAIDLFSHIRQQKYILSQAKSIKFIQIIRPQKYEQVDYHLTWEPLEDNSFQVKVVVSHNDTVFSKMSVILTTLTENK